MNDVSSNLQQAGQICESCRLFWEAQGLPPKTMVHVYRRDGAVVQTPQKQIPVVICLHCDGDVIFTLDKDNE